MEEQIVTDNPVQTSSSCVNCGHFDIVHGHSTALCGECRRTFIKYPVPKWIWLFAAGVSLLMVYGIARMPKYLAAHRHLLKAKEAVEEHNYYTAQQEAARVLDVSPGHLEANALSFTAAGYNMDGEALAAAGERLFNKDLGDAKLLADANAAAAYCELLFHNDTTVTNRVPPVLEKIPAAQVAFFDSLNTSSIDVTNKTAVGYIVAQNLLSLRAMDECKHVLFKTFEGAPNEYLVVRLLIDYDRITGALGPAMALCNKLLAVNHQDFDVLAQKAKVQIRMKHYKEAGATIESVLKYEQQHLAALEASALLLHANNRPNESRQVLAQIRNLEGFGQDSTYSTRLAQVLSGEVIYQ